VPSSSATPLKSASAPLRINSIGVQLVDKNYSGVDGVEISAVDAGGAAERGQIYATNRLVSVDGEECNLSITAAKRLSRKKGTQVSVVVEFFSASARKYYRKTVRLILE
jgi:C-terminal processing protease CtpA/Prc